MKRKETKLFVYVRNCRNDDFDTVLSMSKFCKLVENNDSAMLTDLKVSDTFGGFDEILSKPVAKFRQILYFYQTSCFWQAGVNLRQISQFRPFSISGMWR